MTEEKAKYILREIKSLNRYKKIIHEIDQDLSRINDEIHSIQEPSCPLKNGDDPKIQSHVDKSSVVNSLLSDEMQLINERSEFAKLKAKAESYYARLKIVCSPSEKDFVNAFIRGTSYKRLISEFHYENPYQSMLVIIKRINA